MRKVRWEPDKAQSTPIRKVETDAFQAIRVHLQSIHIVNHNAISVAYHRPMGSMIKEASHQRCNIGRFLSCGR